uniref:Solute carrier organic anion transporter family member n=1 Tax=Cyprinus carpio TaxID=7962 RepID=A0A8C2HTF9_CYPCA
MSEPTAEDNRKPTSQQNLCIPGKEAQKDPCWSSLKIFIVALSFAYFSKTLCGTYMKSTITQIERRFDLSSSVVGLIDGSFEMGNLLFLAVVSHFGARLHRPRLIGMGCFIMAIGSAVTGLPHFFMGRYKYDTVIQGSLNKTVSISPCQYPMVSKDYSNAHIQPSNNIGTDCVKDPGSNMWIYVFLGNALRGIGETPVTPLGISYIDDFAKAENSAFYISCLQTIMLLGPMFGFLLGSLCAKLYVDIGFVSVDSVTITPQDARWVGAWWLGFFVSSAILVLAGVPFWFLPRSLPKQGEEGNENSNVDQDKKEQSVLPNTHSVKLADIAKGFLPSLKKLLCTPAYFLLLCGIVLKFNSFIGLLTFKAKYMEQQFGQSASRLIVSFNPEYCVSNWKQSPISEFLLRTPEISHDEGSLMSQCNQDCSCSTSEWDPVCSDSGITYVSPCWAGCTASTGQGKNTVFHNCSCVLTPSPVEGSRSVSPGQCHRGPGCTRSFTSYMAVSVLSSFINSLGTTPGYMIIIRCITPELKSLALGIQTLVMRTLGGIPAPVYFGALTDSTCLKWGIRSCGGRGACRMYDSNMYRVIFLSLTTCLSGCSYFFIIAVIVLLRKQFRKEEIKALQQTDSKQNETELQSPEMCHPDASNTETSPREKTESANTEC